MQVKNQLALQMPTSGFFFQAIMPNTPHLIFSHTTMSETFFFLMNKQLCQRPYHYQILDLHILIPSLLTSTIFYNLHKPDHFKNLKYKKSIQIKIHNDRKFNSIEMGI